MTRTQAVLAARADLTLAEIPVPWAPGTVRTHAGMVAYLTAVRARALELADALLDGAAGTSSPSYAVELIGDARGYLAIAEALRP